MHFLWRALISGAVNVNFALTALAPVVMLIIALFQQHALMIGHVIMTKVYLFQCILDKVVIFIMQLYIMTSNTNYFNIS